MHVDLDELFLAAVAVGCDCWAADYMCSHSFLYYTLTLLNN